MAPEAEASAPLRGDVGGGQGDPQVPTVPMVHWTERKGMCPRSNGERTCCRCPTLQRKRRALPLCIPLCTLVGVARRVLREAASQVASLRRGNPASFRLVERTAAHVAVALALSPTVLEQPQPP